ncbi:hypothetical protein ACFCQI_01765 [Rhodanobacter sp. FW102-FHT14D06]|uniref:Uncharacterized protein n=2 Tax=unclassified Rhodanobacter TaxID=2621553 RepID=A0AB74UWS9_9GAMM
MDVTFVATQVGRDFRGEVVDLRTQECLMRTGFYAGAETAVSAAASMWRASMAKRAADAADPVEVAA